MVWARPPQLATSFISNRRDVDYWHLADIMTGAVDICFRGQSGLNLDIAIQSLPTDMCSEFETADIAWSWRYSP
jgi:hypothetical protein